MSYSSISYMGELVESILATELKNMQSDVIRSGMASYFWEKISNPCSRP
jgi:hypothetical protein